MKQISSPSLGFLNTRYLQISNNLSDVANASTARTNLGVAIGSDVQAWDAQLDDIATLAVTDGNFIVGDGTNWVAESGATVRTSLGLVAGGTGDIWVEKAGDTMIGALVITPTADGTSILNVTQADTTSVFNVDTTNARVGIGTATPGTKLEVVGSADAIQFIIKAHSSQALTNPLIQLQKSDGTVIGAMHSNDVTNVFFGNLSGVAVTSGVDLAFIGREAGEANTTAIENCAFGSQALKRTTTGSRNFAMGAATLSNNTTGATNTAIGRTANVNNRAGHGNTGIGAFASYNTGYSISSSHNVMIGLEAGYNLQSGSSNTYIGSFAGENIAFYAASGNVLIGYRAGYYQTASSKLYIHNRDGLPLIYGDFTDGIQRVEICDQGDLGPESLAEGDFATHAKWTPTNDLDDTGGNATYTWSANQTSTLTQASADLATAGIGNRWYELTYTVAVTTAPDGDLAATITTGFAATAQTLRLTAGTHKLYFKSKASPGDFVISIVSGDDTEGTISYDNLALKEITGGDLVVNGLLTGGGTGGIKVMGDGKVGIGTTFPGMLLEIHEDQAAATQVRVRNDTSGTTATSSYTAGYGNWSQYLTMQQINPSFTTNGLRVANSAAIWTTANTNGLRIFTNDATDLTLGTNNTANVTIQSGGNVGIGVTTPDKELSFIGNYFGLDNNSLLFNAYYDGATPKTSTDQYGKDASRIFMDGDNITLSIYAGNAADETITWNDVLTIDDSANVGIGVTDPDTKLEVLHAGNQLKLSFDGTDNAIFAVDTAGDLTITPSGTSIIIPSKLAFTQVDLNEYIDSLNDGFMDYRATTAHRFGDGTNQLLISGAGVVTLEGTAKRWLAVRPDLDYTVITAQGKPTQVTVGVFHGYSMPVYVGGQNEELFFNLNVPGRWDEASDIMVHLLVALSGAEDIGDYFKFQLSWEHLSEEEAIPVTSHDVEVEQIVLTSRTAQYSTYELIFTLDYDVDDPDDVIDHDDLAMRLRRIDATNPDITNEIIVLDYHVEFQVDKMFDAVAE